MKKNVTFALIAILTSAVALSGCSISSLFPVYHPVPRKTDKQVDAFVGKVLSDPFFKAFASSEDFRGISEQGDFGNTGDRSYSNDSVLMTTDNSSQICNQVVGWAQKLGVSEMSGPKETSWISMDSRDPKSYCLSVLNGTVKWMPDGLASEEFLMQGQTGKPAFSFVVTLTRTEEVDNGGGIYNKSVAGNPPTGIPDYKPSYRYQLGFTTEKFRSSVTMSALSTSWQHQAAALLDIVASMRDAFPDYVATNRNLNQFAIDYFNKRDNYGAKVVPVLSADQQVDWLDFTTSTGKRICLSVMEPYGDKVNQSANQFGLGGGGTAFEGLGSEVDANQNEATFGNYVTGGCQGMKIVPAHPERLLRVVPNYSKAVTPVPTPTSLATARSLVCQTAKILKKNIEFEMTSPVGDLRELTLGQWGQIKNYRDPAIESILQSVNKFASGRSDQATQDLLRAAGNAGSTAGYIRQAGEQFVGRQTNQQFRFARDTKTLGEYFDKTFNAKAGMNDVGSFRFTYEPLLSYCGMQ